MEGIGHYGAANPFSLAVQTKNKSEAPRLCSGARGIADSYVFIFLAMPNADAWRLMKIRILYDGGRLLGSSSVRYPRNEYPLELGLPTSSLQWIYWLPGAASDKEDRL